MELMNRMRSKEETARNKPAVSNKIIKINTEITKAIIPKLFSLFSASLRGGWLQANRRGNLMS
jgi:hypothetical protein